MRIQSKRPVTVKGKIIGGNIPLICLPIVAKGKKDLVLQAQELASLNPDLLEWRIDGYNNADNIENSLDALRDLHMEIDPIPLLFTCRIDLEGGIQKFSSQSRLKLITACIETGLLDIIDIELCNDENFINSVIKISKKHNVKVILSSHDFKKTPKEELILDTLIRAENLGADIAKIAVMPQNYEDVLVLMKATLKARQKKVEIPLVTMSMGEEGAVSRVAVGIFGSDSTFAIGKIISAPGQIPIEELRQAMSVLYR
jgi:3-dehydroquinate dehydratase-1